MRERFADKACRLPSSSPNAFRIDIVRLLKWSDSMDRRSSEHIDNVGLASNRAFYDWTGERQLAAIGTNAGSPDLPFQSWRRFKEAFAPELIERAVRESAIPVRHIIDPFGGSGTTSLAAQFLGIASTTIELNPFLADLIEAKLSSYNYDRVVRSFVRVTEYASSSYERRKNPFPSLQLASSSPGKMAVSSFTETLRSVFLCSKQQLRR